MRKPHDIKAPDGYTLGGERRVRRDGTVLFNRGWWQLPFGFAERGEYVWVHEEWTADNKQVLEVAPPGYRSYYAAKLDGETIIVQRTSRPDAKSCLRKPAHKAWQARKAA